MRGAGWYEVTLPNLRRWWRELSPLVCSLRPFLRRDALYEMIVQGHTLRDVLHAANVQLPVHLSSCKAHLSCTYL